ncbi:IS66 family insertion sequence element accessory protein TnpB [Myxococcus virescens]|uniref:IS66 family insertion sequence element accessory protein TnpB n=1 Tax=Myxococcus virescens TaxID=83456 RepID=UPI003DA5D3FD
MSDLTGATPGGELLTGDVFLFVGQSRKRAKVLYFDGTGLVLVTKRLYRGRFAVTLRRAQSRCRPDPAEEYGGRGRQS